VAITIDDGVDSSVVDAYLDFAKDSGVRLTFFVTGCYPSWTDNRDKMRPLVESGQIQLANHTWTHPDLTTLSEGGIIDELTQCENLLRNTYGLHPAPLRRPQLLHRLGLRQDRLHDHDYVVRLLRRLRAAHAGGPSR